MECDRLYRSLLERGNEEVFVPLVIDQQTAEQERKLREKGCFFPVLCYNQSI